MWLYFFSSICKHVTTSQSWVRRQHPSMTIDVESGLTNARRGARINTGQSGTMMQLGKGPSNSVAAMLHEFAWLLVLRGVNMPCSRTTGCCQCHDDRFHDLSIRIPMLYHYVTTLPIYFMFVCLFVCLN